MPKRSPNYRKTFQYLYNLEIHGIQPGLERITAILKSIGNPQDKLCIVHVGGTNGKGSTSAIIASILQKAGYRVGLYTSPHLVRFNERIRINGREILDRKIAELVERIRCAIGDTGCGIRDMRSVMCDYPASCIPHPISYPSFFEFSTALAFLYFAEEKVDIAVIEVGLGGRFDATNVGSPLVSVITNVAKDHEAILGNSVQKIAFEKAGILKEDGILISAETKPAVLKVLRGECKRKRAVFYRLNEDFFVKDKGSRDRSLRTRFKAFSFKGRRWLLKDLRTNLLGSHQFFNCACALAAGEVLEEKGCQIPESAVRKGLMSVFWPGRLEIISRRPLIVLDCAHNPAGADMLRRALQSEFHYKRLFLILGIMADKDVKGILSRLVPLASEVILTRPKTMRAASLNLLYTKAGLYADKVMRISSVKGACRAVLAMSKAEDMICVTGSVFTVGEAREWFKRR